MSVFDLSHDVKLSCNMAQLVPVMCKEVVPSDKFRCSQEALVRLQPMVAPMMHRCDVSFHTFFVPSRLLWPNYEKWITNQKVAGNLPAAPTVTFSQAENPINVSSLMDYFGLPLTAGTTVPETVSALPLAAYQFIWNEYYRDQNLQAEVDYELTDGDNSENNDLYVLRKRAWEHDYFTAAAPTAQAGDPVTLPIAGFNDVPVRINTTTNPGGTGFLENNSPGIPNPVLVAGDAPTANVTEDMFAETSQLDAQSATINDLRTAFRLQEWLEKSMRGGKRLFENILIFFGLRSPDERLQRPEYIYGSKTPIQISEVLNTTGTDEAPQGTMAGHGVSVVQPKSGEYHVKEWGFIITIMSVLPRTAYQQGIERMWLKYNDPMQIYWPQFDHLGEQEIDTRELYAFNDASPDLFGYIPRYSEYKFSNSRVAGEFRTTLNFWHMGRIFEEMPALNEDFVVADPTHRVFAVTDPDESKLLIHVYNKVRAIRPMSKFSTPTF